MKKIILAKYGGKTTELIKLAAQNGGYIVCHSLDECSRIQAMAKELDINILFPVSYDEFINGQYRSNGVNSFLIDNIEFLVQHISMGVPISAITLTHPE